MPAAALEVHRWEPGPSPERSWTVQSCIGCGALDSERECTGACDDRPVELVLAADHEAALEAASVAQRRIRELAPLVSRIAGAAPVADERAAYLAVQAEARATLRRLEPEAPAAGRPQPIAAWWCATCDRIEAPRPCIGVCVRHPADMVGLDTHTRAVLAGDAAAAGARALAAVVVQAAWVTPRPGEWQTSRSALAEQARRALSRARVRRPRQGS